MKKLEEFLEGVEIRIYGDFEDIEDDDFEEPIDDVDMPSINTGEYTCMNPVMEAEYQGRKVKLNKPMRGDVKKFKVYVKDGDKVKKVNFGDPDMKIKKSNPERRKSFRARHKCDQKKDKTTAGYWSCRMW